MKVGPSLKPNLFIVGAPKCGTTSMAAYLRQHPDIFVTADEPHYFGADLYWTERFPYGCRRKSHDVYMKYFAGANGASIVGEKSVCYLHATRAPEEINEYNPDSRIIIMIRNPVDFIFSWHAQQVFSGNEPLQDLKDALDAESARVSGAQLPPGISIPSKLLYRHVADFAKGTRRYLDVFGRQRVKVILLEDLSTNPCGVYAETLEFLNVEAGFEPEFEVVNKRKAVRSRYLSDLVRRPNPAVRQAVRTLLPASSLRNRLGRAVLFGLNSRPIPSAPGDSALRRDLEAEMAPRIAELSGLIGRDLSHWIPAHVRTSVA